MNNASMPENPSYSHSFKIEDTAKGIRLSVHVYANSTGEAIEQAFSTYLKAKMIILTFIQVIKENKLRQLVDDGVDSCSTTKHTLTTSCFILFFCFLRT